MYIGSIPIEGAFFIKCWFLFFVIKIRLTILLFNVNNRVYTVGHLIIDVLFILAFLFI